MEQQIQQTEQIQEPQKKKMNKKPILFGLLMVLVGVAIGGSFAYFTSSDTFTNEFKTKPYVMEVTETFQSPDDWTPGTTTNKTIIATNKGDVEAAVRIKLTESWKDANNQSLSLTDASNNSAAIINFASDLNTKWTKSGDYYYYKTKLAKNQSTSTLINSVTFNPAVAISSTDNCVYTLTDNTTTTTKPSNMSTVKSVTCTTTTGGYAGGTYTLEVKVETVQYDQYQTAWNTNVVIN